MRHKVAQGRSPSSFWPAHSVRIGGEVQLGSGLGVVLLPGSVFGSAITAFDTSPVSDLRKTVMESTSSFLSCLPSWYSPMKAIVSSNVALLPSCRYGAVFSTLRRLGTLKKN